MFLYNGTPALGNLYYWVANSSGVDAYGNAYQPLMQVGLTANPHLTFTFDSGTGEGRILFNIPGYFNGGLYAYAETGPPNFAGMAFFGPQNMTVGERDYVTMYMNSSDGASSGNMELSWYDDSNNDHQYAVMDYTGFNIEAGSCNARDPSTGTSKTNPANNESWHPIFLDGGWSSPTHTAAYYRIANDLTHVICVGALVRGTAFTGSQVINSTHPIPSQWCPSATWNIGCAGIPNRAGCEITSGGVFTAEANGVSCTEVDLAGIYPLGLT
jgi:hypothetical protein